MRWGDSTDVEQTIKTESTHELALLAAIRLYKLGRLSSGRAAELAGLSRIEFLSVLSRYHVFPLEDELKSLRDVS